MRSSAGYDGRRPALYICKTCICQCVHSGRMCMCFSLEKGRRGGGDADGSGQRDCASISGDSLSVESAENYI